jgi:hypothetical protein
VPRVIDFPVIRRRGSSDMRRSLAPATGVDRDLRGLLPLLGECAGRYFFFRAAFADRTLADAAAAFFARAGARCQRSGAMSAGHCVHRCGQQRENQDSCPRPGLASR